MEHPCDLVFGQSPEESQFHNLRLAFMLGGKVGQELVNGDEIGGLFGGHCQRIVELDLSF